MTTKLFGKRTESGIQPVSSERAPGTATKLVHILEMKKDDVTGRHDVNVTPGTKVLDVKERLGYGITDGFIRAKGREILTDDTDLFAIAEPGEKFLVTPDAKVGA